MVDRLWAGSLCTRASHDLEGRAQFRIGEHSRRRVPRHIRQECALQPVRGGHLGPHPLQEGQRAHRRRGAPGPHRAGFDLGGGEYVILTEEELESAEPKKSRQIEISDFVPLTEIDPVYFRASYYLAPEGAGADKAYALLRRAMVESGRIGIATMVMRNKEYLVAIRPEERCTGAPHDVLLRRGAFGQGKESARATRRPVT